LAPALASVAHGRKRREVLGGGAQAKTAQGGGVSKGIGEWCGVVLVQNAMKPAYIHWLTDEYRGA
jgi:hypothetical protein